MKNKRRELRQRRHSRVRQKISGTALRPRLSVFRSTNHVYAQLIDDVEKCTLAAASTLDSDIRPELAGKTKVEVAGLVGQLIARRALDSGMKQVVFDCGGHKYHGRVKALAQAAREGGLKF